MVFEQESTSFLNDMHQILTARFSAYSLSELMNPEGKNVVKNDSILRNLFVTFRIFYQEF